MIRTLSLMLIVCLTLVNVASAKNVDLSTVPARDTVQLTIYNSEDITLVRETRKVTFAKGVNPLQFSWANTLIDPSSVELRFLTQGEKLVVLDTTYPHDKPQMLYWNVQSDFDGEATIEITYFTSGISWQADYTVISDSDEKLLHFESFVRVYNNSGEDYEEAQVRLVVGTINLVEKIAQLARLPMSEVSKLGDDDRAQLRNRAMRESEAKFERSAAPAGAAMPVVSKPKEIVKEGLSEYFIYTIEGTETIKHGWSKRMRSFEAGAVPFEIEYRYRPAQYGDQLVRMYVLTNDVKSKLGTTPLPDGVVRVFRKKATPRDGEAKAQALGVDAGKRGESLSYLGVQSIKYIPIGDKIELNLGVDPEVIFELVKLRVWRDEVWMQVHGTNTFRRVGDGAVQVEVNSSVVGWDEHVLYSQRVRNYTGKPIKLEVRRSFGGHVIFKSQLNATLHDFRTVEFKSTVAAGQTKDHGFEIVTKQGRNAKQSNVTLE